jgi:dienelactone hydrolase
VALGALLLAPMAQAQTILFEEDFETGLGEFSASGNVFTATVFNGTNGVRLRGGSNDGVITSPPISTQGFTGITLHFERTTDGTLDFGEFGLAEVSLDGGATFAVVEATQGGPAAVTIPLGAAAENQNAVVLRFRIAASSFFEDIEVDNVVLEGVGSGDPGPGPDPDPDPDPDPENPFARGPDPTEAVLEASSGPFDVDSFRPSFTPGFGAGTIWFPTNTNEGPFAAIAVAPGFTGGESTIDWLGPRLASHGFVVITISTNSLFDFPDSRASQLLAALDAVVAQSDGSSPISGLVDPDRKGLSGHSMGGGGTLIATESDPSIDAAVPLAPWNPSTNFSGIDQPTLIVACENDTVAPVNQHASPMYNSISSSVDKAFVEIDGASHFCPLSGNAQEDTLGKLIVSWMKRFLDEDTRYDPFLCGPNHEADPDISEFRDTCPF